MGVILLHDRIASVRQVDGQLPLAICSTSLIESVALNALTVL